MNRFVIFILILFAAGCFKTYRGPNPKDPQEIKLAEMAADIESRSDQLLKMVPDDPALQEFSLRAARFHNSCLRFGCTSIEGRAAFDQLYYQAGEVDKSFQAKPNSKTLEEWNRIRSDSLTNIARKLGYKPGEQ
jgi:hypothetical protein